MAQFTMGTIDPESTSGTELASLLTQFEGAQNTNHKGSTDPAYSVGGILWWDDAADPIWILKVYDGVGTHTPILRFNRSTNKAILPVEYGGTNGDTQETARTGLGLGDVSTRDQLEVGDYGAESIQNSDVGNKQLTIGKFADTTPNIVFGTDGNGEAVELQTSKEITPFNRVVSANSGMGSRVSYFVMGDGSIRCSGSGLYFRNGASSGIDHYFPEKLIVVHNEESPPFFTKVVCNAFSGYGLTLDNKVYSWGRNNNGQLGLGDTVDRWFAEVIQYFVDNSILISDIICGDTGYYFNETTYFITTDGEVYGCGANFYGQLGDGTTVQKETPVQAGTLTNINQLSVCPNGTHCIALNSSGSFFVWGLNNVGQLGLGDTINRSTPVENLLLINVKKVLAEGSLNTSGADPRGYTLLIDSNDEIWGTGANFYGQLGLGNNTNLEAFTKITTLPGPVLDIAAGGGSYGTSAAIVNDGGNRDLYLWGYNGYGQLGLGDSNNTNLPQKPTADFQGSVDEIKFCRSVNFHSSFVKSGNSFWACGWNGDGALSIGNTLATINTFTRVRGINGIVSEWYTNCSHDDGKFSVLYDDGRVDSSGSNKTGMLGIGITNFLNVPQLYNVKF